VVHYSLTSLTSHHIFISSSSISIIHIGLSRARESSACIPLVDRGASSDGTLFCPLICLLSSLRVNSTPWQVSLLPTVSHPVTLLDTLTLTFSINNRILFYFDLLCLMIAILGCWAGNKIFEKRPQISQGKSC
jgi:hypothetical protein